MIYKRQRRNEDELSNRELLVVGVITLVAGLLAIGLCAGVWHFAMYMTRG